MRKSQAESGSRGAKFQRLKLQGENGTGAISQLDSDLIQERGSWGEGLGEALHNGVVEISFMGQSVQVSD